MKPRIVLIALAGCLMLSACGGVETTTETSAAAVETFTEAPETAAVDACKIEHDISQETYQKILEESRRRREYQSF